MNQGRINKFTFLRVFEIYVFFALIVLKFSVIQAIEDSFKCSRKKIVIEIYKGGFGNKICGIVTGLAMALEMGRTVEIEWETSQHLHGSYDDFFVAPSSIGGQTFPFIKRYNLTEHAAHDVIYTHMRCLVDLSAGLKTRMFWFFKNPAMLQRLNEHCDLIRIRSNVDLSPLFFDPVNAATATRFKSKLPRVIHDLFEKQYLTLRPEIINVAESFRKSVNWVSNSPNKWLSIHSRGLFDGNAEWTTIGIKCAKALVEQGFVKYVFLASDQSRMEKIAAKTLPPGSVFFYTNKTTVLSIREMSELGMFKNISKPPGDPSYSIRNESFAAAVEWYLVGQGDYCMTPTVSTFAQTAILRTNCFYVDALKGAKCTEGLPPPTSYAPRTTDPELNQRNIWIERFFKNNTMCDEVCQNSIMKNEVGRKKFNQTWSPRAIAGRKYCDKIPDPAESVKKWWFS